MVLLLGGLFYSLRGGINHGAKRDIQSWSEKRADGLRGAIAQDLTELWWWCEIFKSGYYHTVQEESGSICKIDFLTNNSAALDFFALFR